jgi:hypothetical protein
LSAELGPGASGPRLFVLGASGTGKTPLARQVAHGLQVPHVMASEWVRRVFPDDPGADRQSRIEAMTRFSLAALSLDPQACTAYLHRHHALALPCVIEGMRNPADFVRTFDPRTDLVVTLELRTSALVRTGFEAGLEVIAAYVRWLVSVGLLQAERVQQFAHDDIAELDAAIAAVLARAREHFPADPPPAGLACRVHADIPLMRTSVREELLYGGDPARAGSFVPCTAFSLGCYPGSVPTFQVRLDDGAVFAYVPPSALSEVPPGDGPQLELLDLVYHNCPDGDIVITGHQGLAGPVSCYFRRRDLWMDGTYRFTVDWYRGNDLLHCISLANGQVAFLPNHKVKFGAGHRPGFEPYKKMRNTWRV